MKDVFVVINVYLQEQFRRQRIINWNKIGLDNTKNIKKRSYYHQVDEYS